MGNDLEAQVDKEASPQSKPETPVSATDWDGPTDPSNPQNWSRAKRLYHTTIPAAIGFLW